MRIINQKRVTMKTPKVIIRKVQKEGTNKSLLSSLSRTQKKKEKYSKTTVKAEDTQNLIKKTDDEESKNDYDFDKDIMKKYRFLE